MQNQNATQIIIDILAMFVILHTKEQSSYQIISKGKRHSAIMNNSPVTKQIESLKQSRQGLYLVNTKADITDELKSMQRQYLVGENDRITTNKTFFTSSINQKYLLKFLLISRL
ncbi:hypothetical protein ABPG74_009533 [Tetrahymena malaccensis]